MITVLSTNPQQDATDVYRNQEISVKFSKPIASLYITSEYMKLYHVYEENGQDKYQQVSVIVSHEDNIDISIKPTINLEPSERYSILIRGDLDINDATPDGIRSTDDDIMDGNYILNFVAGEEFMEESEEEEEVEEQPVEEDGEFVSQPTSTTLKIVDSEPSNMDYGVIELPEMSIEFDQNIIVANTNAFSVQSRSIDPRYINTIPFSIERISYSGRIARLEFDGPLCVSGNILYPGNCNQLPPNHEFEVRIDRTYIQSDTGDSLSSNQAIQFASEFIPMYCDVYDVREAAIGYISDSVPDYLISKMIHANSKKAAKMYKIDYYNTDFEDIPNNIADKIYNYVVCKTAYDLLLSPAFGKSAPGGRVSSKSLGDFSISYDYGDGTKPPLEELKDSLKSCIRSSSVVGTVDVGIKSGKDKYYPGRRRSWNSLRRDNPGKRKGSPSYSIDESII